MRKRQRGGFRASASTPERVMSVLQLQHSFHVVLLKNPYKNRDEYGKGKNDNRQGSINRTEDGPKVVKEIHETLAEKFRCLQYIKIHHENRLKINEKQDTKGIVAKETPRVLTRMMRRFGRTITVSVDEIGGPQERAPQGTRQPACKGRSPQKHSTIESVMAPFAANPRSNHRRVRRQQAGSNRSRTI